MHILIDVQGYQSESKFRGVGRSTYEMSRAIIKNAGQHRVSILMNGMYSIDSINEIKKSWGDILPQEEMIIFSAAGPTALRDCENHPRSVAATLARELAIANINPDVVFIINFYEGFDDSYTVSIPQTTVPWKTVCVCHDLIPLLNKERYLGEPNFRQYYYDKLAQYERADAIFAISRSSMQEVIDYTSIPAEKIINISSGVSDSFKIKDYTHDEIKDLRNKYHLPQEFILSLAMIEPRKNIEALIHAYSLLPHALQQSYPLVLAYKISTDEKERLYRVAENYGLSRNQLIFTGFLNDSDLIALYNLCKIFVFPSIHEGFGLPPLEAMRCGHRYGRGFI